MVEITEYDQEAETPVNLHESNFIYNVTETGIQEKNLKENKFIIPRILLNGEEIFEGFGQQGNNNNNDPSLSRVDNESESGNATEGGSSKFSTAESAATSHDDNSVLRSEHILPRSVQFADDEEEFFHGADPFAVSEPPVDTVSYLHRDDSSFTQTGSNYLERTVYDDASVQVPENSRCLRCREQRLSPRTARFQNRTATFKEKGNASGADAELSDSGLSVTYGASISARASSSTEMTKTSILWNHYGNDKAVNKLATISPGTTLEFCVTSPDVQPTDVICIKSNLSKKNVAFKVKTTTLGRYRVRPAIGIVKPYDAVDVIITLEENIDDPSQIAKDKFLIICQEVDTDVLLSQVSELIRAVPKDLQTEHRLRVIMSRPSTYNSPRKSEVTDIQPSNTSRVSASNASVASSEQLKIIQQQLQHIRATNSQLESRLGKYGVIMIIQCLLLLTLTAVILWSHLSPHFIGHHRQQAGSCKPWQLDDV